MMPPEAGTPRGSVPGMRAPRACGRPPWLSRSGDEGSALVEAVFVIVVLLVPLVWVALALLRVEAAGYAVRTAAREAARVYVTAPTGVIGSSRAEMAARLAFEDQDTPQGQVGVACSAQPCLTPGATVTAHAATTVPLPFVPGWLAGPTHLRITVSSDHEEKVEQYGGQR